jgi:hypothetical protein
MNPSNAQQMSKLEIHLPDGSSATVCVPFHSDITKYIDAVRQLLGFVGFHHDNINAYLGDN